MKKHTGAIIIILFLIGIYGFVYLPSTIDAYYFDKYRKAWNRMLIIAGQIDRNGKIRSIDELADISRNEDLKDPFTGDNFKLYFSKARMGKWLLISPGPDKKIDLFIGDPDAAFHKEFLPEIYFDRNYQQYNATNGIKSKGDIIFTESITPEGGGSGNTIDKINAKRSGTWRRNNQIFIKQNE